MNTKKLINEFKLTIDSKSVNEAFARVAVSAFVTPLDPTLEEIADFKNGSQRGGDKLHSPCL